MHCLDTSASRVILWRIAKLLLPFPQLGEYCLSGGKIPVLAFWIRHNIFKQIAEILSQLKSFLIL